jgi:hypothetical protein
LPTLLFSVVRYAIGKHTLPYFTKWVLDKFDVIVEDRRTAKPLPEQNDFPSPSVDTGIVEELSEGLILIMPLQQVFW